jgi:hypothetical protein
MGVCVQEPWARERNRELHYTELTTVQDSVDGWRAGGSVVATRCAEDLTGGDTESMSRRHHGRPSRKDQDVRQGTAAVFLEQLSKGRGSLRQSL